MFRPHGALIALLAAAALSLGISPNATADDTDTQFIGEVSFFLDGTYLDPATIRALVADAKKVCAMSDDGYSSEAMAFVQGRWRPSDPFGFMGAATRAYCPQHLDEWSGL